MDDLVGEWRAARAEWAAANAAGKPVQYRNRIMTRIWDLGHRIAEHPESHDEIIALSGRDQDPDLRLGAALVREHWDIVGAADTLVSVIHDSGAWITRPVTMTRALEVKSTPTARTAALCLFNIDSGRGNTGVASTGGTQSR
jgi:hypothetical protein